MQPGQPADLDHASNLRESSGYASKSDSVQMKSVRNMSDRTSLHNSRLADSASATAHHVGTCSASIRPVRLTSLLASTPPNQHFQQTRQRNPGYARTRQGDHFLHCNAFLFWTADRNTRRPRRHAHRKRQQGTPLSGSQIGQFSPFCHWHSVQSSSQLDSADYAPAQTSESSQSLHALL